MLAASQLEETVERLQSELELGEPFADPGVEYFGLRNAVFALGDTFLEVVSPLRDDAPAARMIRRRGGSCGYMLMFQVAELSSARERARRAGVREVFEVDLPDMSEVHLHPADIGGAIVSLSQPDPPEAWRWGGSGWKQRSAPLRVKGATLALPDAESVGERWRSVIGELEDVHFLDDAGDRGVVEILLVSPVAHDPCEIAGVSFTFEEDVQ